MTTAETPSSGNLRCQKLLLPPRHHSHSEVYSLQTDKELEYSPNCQRASCLGDSQGRFAKPHFELPLASASSRLQWRPDSITTSSFTVNGPQGIFSRFLISLSLATCVVAMKERMLSLACRVVLLRHATGSQRPLGQFLIDFFPAHDQWCDAAEVRPTYPIKSPKN